MADRHMMDDAAMAVALENLAVWHAEIDRAGELMSLQIEDLAAHFAKNSRENGKLYLLPAFKLRKQFFYPENPAANHYQRRKT